MNECLTTPRHEKQIGYWVSEKGKCMKWLYNYIYINTWTMTMYCRTGSSKGIFVNTLTTAAVTQVTHGTAELEVVKEYLLTL